MNKKCVCKSLDIRITKMDLAFLIQDVSAPSCAGSIVSVFLTL